MIYSMSPAQKAHLLVTLYREFEIPLDESERTRKQYALGERFELLVECSPELAMTSFAIAEAINTTLCDDDTGLDNLDVGLNVFTIARQTGFDPASIRAALRISGFWPKDMQGNYVRSNGAKIFSLKSEVFEHIPGHRPAEEHEKTRQQKAV